MKKRNKITFSIIVFFFCSFSFNQFFSVIFSATKNKQAINRERKESSKIRVKLINPKEKKNKKDQKEKEA